MTMNSSPLGRLVTNPAGWDCRLVVGHGLMMSLICRSPGEVFTTWVAWKRTMNEKGWSACVNG